VLSGELYREYQKFGRQAVVGRAYRKYMQKMVRLGLVKGEGYGTWKRYEIVIWLFLQGVTLSFVVSSCIHNPSILCGEDRKVPTIGTSLGRRFESPRSNSLSHMDDLA